MKESHVPEGVPGGGDGLRKEAWAARMEGGGRGTHLRDQSWDQPGEGSE